MFTVFSLCAPAAVRGLLECAPIWSVIWSLLTGTPQAFCGSMSHRYLGCYIFSGKWRCAAGFIIFDDGRADRGCWCSLDKALRSSEKLVFKNSETDNRLTVGLEYRGVKNEGVSKKFAAVEGNGVSKKVDWFGVVEQGELLPKGEGLAVGEC